jgi:beta-glucuronidase
MLEIRASRCLSHRQKMLLGLCLVGMLTAMAANGVTEEKPGSRLRVSLDGLWKFYPAFDEISGNHQFMGKDFPEVNDAEEKHHGWMAPDFDDGLWWDIPVPGSWNAAFDDLWSYEGHGWYRKTMAIPEAWRGKRVLFHSDGANYRTVLYVNGVKVGAHEGGYTAFSFPIEERLVFGADNTLAIAVDNIAKLERVPMERHDWWTHGGLFRPLSLEVMAQNHLENVKVVTESLVPTRVRVSFEVSAPTARQCLVRLQDPSGKVCAEESVKVLTKGENAVTLSVKEARLWSPETPHLYTLTLELLEADTVGDRWTKRVGIRTVAFNEQGFLLNGKPYLIKGINRYEDYADTGGTSTPESLRKDVDLIKALGANAVRCHYPNSPMTYALYDEVGLLSVCEVPLYQWGRPGHCWENLDAAKSQLQEMIVTLRNHPSVAMWSISNENRIRPRAEGEEHKRLSEMVVTGNQALADLAKSLDPARPVIEPSNRWPEDILFEKTDTCSVNVYLGASAPQVDYLPEMKTQVHERFAALRERWPGKSILVTEFGSWALRGLKTDSFPGEIYQAELLRTQWEAFMDEEGFAGGFIWVFADSDVHRKYTRIYEMRCAYGLYDLQRRPKASVKTIQELWR